MTARDRNDQIQHRQSGDDVVDLRALFALLWAGKWLIGGVTFVGAVVSVVVVLTLPNIYRAEALLAPNNQEAAGGLSALATQYGGLASLAGINLGRNAGDKTSLGLEILKSRQFVTEFIERRDILVPLMAAKAWNPESGTLEIDPELFDEAAARWIRPVSPPKKTAPSSQEAYVEFMGLLSVRQDDKSGLVTLSIEHRSATVAKEWVDWLVDDLNSTIMRQDVAEAEQAIAYLNRQIKNISLAGLQGVFFGLIEEQTKTIMLAQVTDEYLLKTIDPAIAPEVKSKPKRSLIVILATILSSILAVAVVLILASIRDDSRA